MLLAVTKSFWEDAFTEFYKDSPDIKFRGLDLNPELVLFGMGIPEPIFNYYIDFDTVFLYELDTADPPGAEETFAIMANANFTVYILDYVRTVPGFESNDEVIFLAREVIVPALVPAPAPRVSGNATNDSNGRHIPTEAAKGNIFLNTTGKIQLSVRQNRLKPP